MAIEKIEFVSKKKLKDAMREVKGQIADALHALPIESQVLAEKSAKWMAQRVTQRTKRSHKTGRLAEALVGNVHFRKRGQGFTIGIAEVKTLPKYWAMINYGGKIDMKGKKAVPGFWDDGDGRSSAKRKRGSFTYTPIGDPQRYMGEDGEDYPYFWMKPVKRIEGFHYIFYAHQKMRSYVRTQLRISKQKKSKR